MRSLTREQCRRIDQLALREFGLPGIILMENAARSATERILGLLRWTKARAVQAPPADRPRVAVLCGGGNNGGDGYAIARHLHNAGVAVCVYAAADPARLSGDAAVNRGIIERLNVVRREILTPAQLDAAAEEWRGARVLVDALLGTGFSGAVREPLASVIRRCNEAAAGRKVVAVDVPSGLDCDTGIPAKPTIHAALTVTFVARKTGFARKEARPCLGRVVVGDIGIPPEMFDKLLGPARD
jgi:NAD(P)H-hydrate epimerase